MDLAREKKNKRVNPLSGKRYESLLRSFYVLGGRVVVVNEERVCPQFCSQYSGGGRALAVKTKNAQGFERCTGSAGRLCYS